MYPRHCARSVCCSAEALEALGEGSADDPEYRAKVEALADEQYASPEVQDRLRTITEEAFNNTENWVGRDDELVE